MLLFVPHSLLFAGECANGLHQTETHLVAAPLKPYLFFGHLGLSENGLYTKTMVDLYFSPSMVI